MDKSRLANLASYLIIKQIYSDSEIDVMTKVFDDGQFGIIVVHFDDRYDYHNKSLTIYEWHSDAHIMRTFEYMKDVIAGERLVTDE
ncbi:hypothetical protein [Mammaliicoccus sp. D-M17]|uniref:hypothetical protein n=1 Tax=Mammaliicoccus sp. D-M17 TaxID=2898677 RepID=UPI001EFB53AF|nr:hypothetical protein [Mammaliicoccus sp. D-M17]